MEIRQYYYTSSIQTKTGQAGFQIKAMSPGISSTLQSTIARLIDYRIPPDLDVSAVETHPVALRYLSTDTGDSILVCSQSSGQDEYGRPGNFFAHVLVLRDRSAFMTTPPIFFWKSSLWRSEDREERREVVSLSMLPSSEMVPTLDSEKIRCFLAQEKRYDWLSPLLGAVLQYGKTQRRLVILDKDESIAHWIAAVSYLLPPEYRPLLTFATYHHDPGHAPYLITGATSPSQLRAILMDAHSYFLLDATTGRVSPIEASPYARMVSQALHAGSYETWLSPLLTTFARHFPQPVAMDGQLDLLALYARIQLSPSSEEFTDETYHTIQTVLPSFATRSQLLAEDINELIQIERHMRATIRQPAQRDVHTTYQQILSLLKEHTSIREIILEELQQFAESRSVSQSQASASKALSILHDLYGFQDIIDTINSSAYLQWATQFLPDDSRANLECLLVLTGGEMTAQLMLRVQHMLENLTSEAYLALLEHCLPAFFRHAVSDEAHRYLIHALYPRGVQLNVTRHFWQIYLNTLGTLWQHSSTREKALRLLDFWFATSPSTLPEGYPLQHFFLLLPTCEPLQADQFRANTPRSGISPRSWYPSLQLTLAQRHTLLTPAGHTSKNRLSGYVLTLHQRSGLPGTRRLSAHLTLDAEIRRCFEKDHLLSHHRQLIQLYTESSAEHFWASYWQQFLWLLTTRESTSVLEVFVFWFEYAFEIVDYTSLSMPQEFFLGGFRALRSASQIPEFSRTMQDMYEQVQQEQSLHTGRLCSWFPLIMALAEWRPQ